MACSPAWSGLVINEFLPDPAGADGGREFVEILNTGPEPVDLTGVSLDFANGAEDAVWVTRWVQGEAWTLEPGARFLIVDRNWLGPENWQAQAYLGLQNGPDAIRLARSSQVLDLVGYGPLTDPRLMETSPAPIQPGLALARRPDGWDSGDNSLDFVSHTPTPGAPNFLDRELQLISLMLDPPAADRPDLRVSVSVSLRNSGMEPLGPGILRLLGFDQEVEVPVGRLDPDQEVSLAWFLTPGYAGNEPLALELTGDPSGEPLHLALGRYQVGPGDLVLNEVEPAPGAGQGEWIELASNATEALPLAGFRLRDEDGDWVELPDRWLEPGQFLVLAQDPEDLLDWIRANEEAGWPGECSLETATSRVEALPGAWPSLNNTPPADRAFADRIFLADSLGTVLDQVTLGGIQGEPGTGAGRSLERVSLVPANPEASNWAVCTSLAGATCACTNSVSTAVTSSSDLSVNPAVLDPQIGQSTLHFRFTVPPDASGWRLQVFDTWGALVRDLGGDRAGPGPRDLIWDGRDEQGQGASQGPYVVSLALVDGQGQVLGRRRALALVRRQ